MFDYGIVKKYSYKEFAKFLFDNRETLPSMDIHCIYDEESQEVEWHYKIAVLNFADNLMVVASYYGGGTVFVMDITDDCDSSALECGLSSYLRDEGFSGDVYVNNIRLFAPTIQEQFIAEEVNFRLLEVLEVAASQETTDKIVELLNADCSVMFDYYNLDFWLEQQYEKYKDLGKE